MSLTRGCQPALFFLCVFFLCYLLHSTPIYLVMLSVQVPKRSSSSSKPTKQKKLKSVLSSFTYSLRSWAHSMFQLRTFSAFFSWSAFFAPQDIQLSHLHLHAKQIAENICIKLWSISNQPHIHTHTHSVHKPAIQNVKHNHFSTEMKMQMK